MDREIFKEGGIRLVRSSEISPAFINQMSKTILGREGQLRYQLGNAIKKAEELTDTSFLELWWKDRLIGCIALSVQSVRIDGIYQNVLYVRYFSIAGLLQNRQGQPGSSSKQKASNLIKSLIVTAFDQPKLLSNSRNISGIYAYVEDQNVPSLRNVIMNGFEKVDSFTTLLYSRIYPRKRVTLTKADKTALERIVTLLDQSYQEYDLVPNWKNLLSDSSRDYFYYERDNKIQAGLSISRNFWTIHNFPGLIGRLNVYLLSRIPILNNIFFGKKLEFLSIEAVYLTNGKEYLLPKMIETCMQQCNVHHAMLWVPLKGKLTDQANQAGQFGLLQKLRASANAGVYYKKFGNSTAPAHPCYISADGIS